MLARFLIGSLTVILVATVLLTFYDFAGSPTDENLFTDLPCHLAFRHSDPSIRGSWIRQGMGQAEARPPSDTVKTGDLLMMCNGQTVSSFPKLRSLLAKLPADSSVSVYLFRPSLRLACSVRAPRSAMAESLFVEIPNGALVASVVPGGASDRAGMRVGDIIVRINGNEFKTANEGDILLRRAQIGHVIIYDVLRELTPLALPVTLARFGFPLSLMVLSLSGLFWMIFGAFVALKRPELLAARLVGLGAILLGFVIAILGIRREVDANLFITTRGFALIITFFLGLAISWHGSLMFPAENKEALRRRWLIRGEYIFAVVCSGILIVLKLIDFASVTLDAFLLAATIIPILLYGIGVRLAVRHGVDAAGKERRRLMKFTGIGVGVGIIALVIILFITGNLDQWGFIGIPFLLMPLAALYTIGRYRLLGMNLRVRRTIQYVLTSILWVIVVLSGAFTLLTYCLAIPVHLPLVSIHGLSIEVSDASVVGGPSNEIERLLFVGLGLLAWGGVSRLRKFGQRGIDRYFDRTQYDYRLALSKISSVLSTNLSMTGLGKGIVERLTDLMKLRRAAVFFFRNEKACCCREAYGLQESEWTTFCMNEENLIASAARNATGPLSRDLLPPILKEEFTKYQFDHIIPVRSKDRLIAALVLGEKLSEAPYTAEDIDFLAAVALQASVAIENAFLYEELAEQERMKQELEIARRIQLASLPQATPSVPGLDIAGGSVPALEVGGDFYDYLLGDDGGVTIIVGDVSGKGTSAALYMSKMQGVLRSLHTFVHSPAELFRRANSLLGQGMEKSSYVTALGVHFDPLPKQLTVARAGHLPLFRFDAQRQNLEHLIPRGLGLALDQSDKFSRELEERRYPCKTGDVFVFITDGISEAMNPNREQFGEERIEEVLRANIHESAQGLRDKILEKVLSFAGSAAQHDDQTIVVVRITDDAK